MSIIDFAGNGAVLSACEKYRYRLDRHVGSGERVFAFFGVNPSTADANLDDATVRKWRGFCFRLSASRFIVGNVFAYRATDVRALASVEDPVGPENLEHIFRIVKEADVLVPCWGNSTKVPKALRQHFPDLLRCLRASGKPVMCWGKTAGGDPKHPLMLGYDTPLIDFA